MEAKKIKNSKKADLELRKFSIEVATYLGADFTIAKADEIFKYLKSGTITKTVSVHKK